jgi:REP element-mobilizing transposase RayT
MVNQIVLYVLAAAARRYNVRIHVLCVLSNHLHIVLTDPDAKLPRFEQYMDSLVGRAMNAFLGRWESFFSPSSYSAVALVTPDAIVEKAAYVLANPAAADLVRHGREWPGLWSAPESIGGAPLVVARPKVFFRANGNMPESAELQLTPPPGFSAEEFRARLVAALAHAEDDAQRERASQGRKVLGAAAVRAQDPYSRPASFEPRRQLNPHVAARDKWKRIQALTRRKTFLRQYREALADWRAGARDAMFPAGTYLLRVLHGVLCAAAP